MRIRWLLLAPCLLLGASSLHAATIYVDGRRPADGADGKSWTTAFTNVAAGLRAAGVGDEVWVAAGVYEQEIVVPSGVRLYGGFVGTETFRDQRPGLPSLTTIAGRPARSAAEVVRLTHSEPGTIVDGFTITAPGMPGHGIVRIEQGSPTLSHNIITMGPILTEPLRFPVPADALVECLDGRPVIRNNIITGGNMNGISCAPGSAVIVNNTIVGNAAAGIITGMPNDPPILVNNIIAFNRQGVYVAKGMPPSMRGNCVFGNAAMDYARMDNRTGSDGNISADPRLAFYADGNLHIQPDSPCIDAGADAVDHGDLDIDLLPRVMGARVDIGADESDGRTWTPEPRHVIRVAMGGDDTNDGSSWPLAKRTVQAAINAVAVTGGDVWVAQGTYAGTNMTPYWGGIRLPSHVRLYGGFAGVETEREQRDWARYPTVLTNPTPGFIVTAVSGNRTSRLDGFVLMGDQSAGGAAGISCVGASPEIVNNVFTGLTTTDAPSLIWGRYSFPLVDNNALVGNTGGRGSIMAFLTSTPTITRNVILSNVIPGARLIMVFDTGVIKDNLIAGNSAAADGAIFGVIGTGAVIAGNTIVGNSAPVLKLPNVPITLVNNIFQANGSASEPWPATLPAGTSIRNNCFYQSGDATALIGSNGNIAAYPGFVDLRNGDYRLGADSPCVDAGDDTLVQPGDVDLDGNPRIQGRRVDIGAFEFAGVASSPSVPDVLEAIKIAAGIQSATPDSMEWLNRDKQSLGISISDAVALLKALKARSDSME